MKFHLDIKKRIVLMQSSNNLLSKKYVLSLVENHMEQFGMIKTNYSENELYYLKSDPFWMHRRKDQIGNISITVACHDEEIITEFKSDTFLLLLPLIVMVIIVPLIVGNPFIFSLSDKPIMWLFISYCLFVSGRRFLQRNFALNEIRNEIQMKLMKHN